MSDLSEFKPAYAEAARGEAAWNNVCAKLGQPAAMGVRAGGTSDENHEKRKAVRRAVNALNLATADRDFTAEEDEALHHAAVLVARLDSFIDHAHGIAASAGPKLLRNAADFASHYSKGRHAQGAGASDLSIADFLRGVGGMSTTPAVRAALSVGTDAAGGFSVPSILMPGILGAMAPASSLLQAGAGIVPLEDGAKTYTYAAVDTIPTAAWRAENGALAESDPAFRAVVATPRSLSFMFKVSRELLQDGQNLADALYGAIGQAFAKELDRVGLRGTGTAPQPRGLLNTSGIQAVGNGTNGASLANYTNFFSAAQAILQADCPMPTAAIMSPRSLVKLGGLVDSTGQPLRLPGMLENVRMLSTSQIPNNLTVGTSTDCTELYVGDFTKLQFMMRENVSIQPLAELYAANGQVGFACHMRVDVAVLYAAAFAVVTGVRA